MKIKTTLYVYHVQYSFMDEPEYEAYTFDMGKSEGRTLMCTQEVELEVPDNFDPRPQQIEILQEKKQNVMAEYQKTITEIDHNISKLQAIAFSGEPS